MYQPIRIKTLACTLAATLLAGCASTPPVKGSDPSDPYENTNRKIYNFNDTIDRKVFTPVARGYVQVTPDPVRAGVTKFFDNVGYLNVITNDFLQGKVTQGASDTGRFLVNSTVGVGGLFDPATKIGMPAHDEDLGQTFGIWGMGEGAYLMVPFLGPSSYRDLPDAATSIALNPMTWLGGVGGIITWPLGALHAVNARANMLAASNIRDQAAVDPYTFVREAYRQQRQYKIYDGNPPMDENEVNGDSGDHHPPAAGAEILKVY